MKPFENDKELAELARNHPDLLTRTLIINSIIIGFGAFIIFSPLVN